MSVEGRATGSFIGATLNWDQGQVQHSPAVQALQEVVNPVTDGLSTDFLARHSQDRSLLQSLRGQFGREIEREEQMMREQRTRERREREEREMQESERWLQQRNAVIADPQWLREPAGCAQTTQALCSHSNVTDSRDSNISRGSMLNRDFSSDSVESTDNSVLVLEQRVGEARALAERVTREREEWEQFGREIERKEQMIREQRARERREKEREMLEAERWPQQQDAVIANPRWLCEPRGCSQTTQALCSHSSVPDSRDSNISRGSMLNRDFSSDSVESTDNSLLALEQRVAEACALVERVIREREEREQFGREIERKEQMIRKQRARQRREREEREMREAERWPQQQDAVIADPQWQCEPRGCSQTTQALCSHSSVRDSRDSNISRGSIISRDFGTDSTDSTGNSLLALEQSVTDQACSLVERVIKEREEREQFEREIERKEQMIREQRARERREREEREMQEAERWPQQQDAITPRSQWLCEHYQRYCRVRFPCCTQFYPCHRCHNNSRACGNEAAKACHATHLKCSHCHHEQEVIILLYCNCLHCHSCISSTCTSDKNHGQTRGLVSKETVVLRRWARETQKFGFIK